MCNIPTGKEVQVKRTHLHGYLLLGNHLDMPDRLARLENDLISKLNVLRID